VNHEAGQSLSSRLPRADSAEAADAVSGEPLGGECPGRRTCCRAFVGALHVERPVTRLRSLVMARSTLGVTADPHAHDASAMRRGNDRGG
jgi:hypothetical protein